MELGLEGRTVTQAHAGFTVSLAMGADNEVRIETDFSLCTSDGDRHFSLGTESIDHAALDSLLGQKVTSSVVAESGALFLAFSDGTSLRVEPHDTYEAWTFAGPGGRKVVCMAGGELAVWSEADN
jgi:uncharacterized protein DUF6188